jgi:aminoglycoside phosphotransferase family enzyme
MREPGCDVDIAQKVAFLGSPAAYADQPSRVERIETHFSWVFLTERRVYKLKKPLRTEHLDFSSLASRHRDALAETRLNRRLAADVYLGVVPLTIDARGRLAIGGVGEVVDWLVEMVRLPAEEMLDQRLAACSWQRGEIEGLGDLLARFFANARAVAARPRIYIERLRGECRSSIGAFRVIGSPGLAAAAGRAVRSLERFIRRRENLLRKRRLVEGHGDLRPEHIWLATPPRIIDCLEFRRDLRLLDPIEELAFLAMECDRLGVPDIGPVLFRRYRLRGGDGPPGELVAFYKALGAVIRARIAILHLREIPVRDPGKWPCRAAEYLEIAAREIRRLS